MRGFCAKACRRTETEACYSDVTKIGMMLVRSGVGRGNRWPKTRRKRRRTRRGKPPLSEAPVKLPEAPVKLPEAPVKLPGAPVKLPEAPVRP